MKLFNQLLRYLYPKRKFRAVPLQIISDYDIRTASDAEKILMLANVARSPDCAREVMQRHKSKRLADILKTRTRRAVPSASAQMKRLLMNIAGHQPGDPYRCNMKQRDQL